MLKNGRPYTCEWSERDKAYFGFSPVDSALSDSLTDEELDKAKEWVKKFVTPRRTVNHDESSYTIKHHMERYAKTYISNNQAKDIMLQCGFDPVNQDALNWEYRIKINIKKGRGRFTICPKCFHETETVVDQCNRKWCYDCGGEKR